MNTKLKKIAGVLAQFSFEQLTVKPKAVCALGLLYYNTGKMNDKCDWEDLDISGDFEILQENYGITQEQYKKLYHCPVCEKSDLRLNDFLIHLNDYHDPKNRLKGITPLTFKEIGQILEKEDL